MHEPIQMRFHVPMSRPDAAARLFCFSHAGGNASVYAPWARALGNRPIEVVAAQLPGRNGDRHEAPSGDLDRLVNDLAHAIGSLAGPPYGLFGHTLGAPVPFRPAP